MFKICGGLAILLLLIEVKIFKYKIYLETTTWKVIVSLTYWTFG